MPNCKACNREIIFKKNFMSGRTLPLERVKTIYREDLDGVTVSPMEGAYLISHFITCPEASTFSKKKKETKNVGQQEHSLGGDPGVARNKEQEGINPDADGGLDH